MSTLLLLQPPTYFAGQKNRSTGNQACGIASHFLDRIVNSAVTVRSQQLHKLQQQGATKKRPSRQKQCVWDRQSKTGRRALQTPRNGMNRSHRSMRDESEDGPPSESS